MPSPAATTAMGIGPSSRGRGTLRPNRFSSPYASALAVAAAIGAESASAAASAVPTRATTAGGALVDSDANTTATNPHGATTRNKVSPHGRGANRASNPTAQIPQSSTAAQRAG